MKPNALITKECDAAMLNKYLDEVEVAPTDGTLY